ncbi:MAG: Crp/Fnr family transcriptional regulator [Bacteroidota bacterium]
MNSLITFIQANLPDISKNAIQIIEDSFVQKNWKKGALLLSQGDVCKNLYFLSEGICRSFSTKDEEEITTWFSFTNDFITSFTSFFPRVPSYESIEMLSDGMLYQISYERLHAIRSASLEIERSINYFSLLYTIQLEKRLFLIQTLTASEKYKAILQHEPHLIQHISNKHLASYLGITRETLSRIRSGIS